MRTLGQEHQLIRRGRPASELPFGQVERQLAQRLAGLQEQGLGPLEGEKLGRDLGTGVDGSIRLRQGDMGWWWRMYLIANRASAASAGPAARAISQSRSAPARESP
jgi:hypothetical protein